MGGGEFSAHKNFFWPIARARIFFLVESHAGTFLEGRGGGISFMRYWLVKKFTGKKVTISQMQLSRILNTISFYVELGVGRSRHCFFTLIQGVQFAKTYRSKIYLGYVWLFRSM